MASQSVTAAVEARLAAQWATIAPAIPIKSTNLQGAVPDDGSAFLTIEYPIANEEQITVGNPGNNVFRETGAFRIFLSVPIGAGMTDPSSSANYGALIDQLRAAFRCQQFGGVNTWAPSPPTTNSQSDSGAYFELSFAVPYYADTLG